MSDPQAIKSEVAPSGPEVDKYISRQASDEKVEFGEAQVATTKEHNLTLSQALRAYPKAIMWSILLSSAVVMEGYDTILVSANVPHRFDRSSS